jgi:UPF0176 protein
MTYTVAAFYKFITITDPGTLRERMLIVCREHGIIGTILIAHEGVNGTIAGSADNVDALLASLAAALDLPKIEAKRSRCEAVPFRKLRVRLRPEIITLNQPQANPAVKVGTYVEPADWNALIADPDVVLIDTRNTYEIGVGTFPGALDPKTRSFGQFPAFIETKRDQLKGKKVAMFCTGGIRCEKASAYLLDLGFPEVYHLKGGILKYLEDVPATESKWQGECFVFDRRVALVHGVREGSFTMCFECGSPVPEGQECPSCSAERSTG